MYLQGAIVTPILAKPTIVAISSERFSIITAMTCPLYALREKDNNGKSGLPIHLKAS